MPLLYKFGLLVGEIASSHIPAMQNITAAAMQVSDSSALESFPVIKENTLYSREFNSGQMANSYNLQQAQMHDGASSFSIMNNMLAHAIFSSITSNINNNMVINCRNVYPNISNSLLVNSISTNKNFQPDTSNIITECTSLINDSYISIIQIIDTKMHESYNKNLINGGFEQLYISTEINSIVEVLKYHHNNLNLMRKICIDS